MQSNTKRIILNTLSAIITFFIAVSSVFLVLGITLNFVYIKAPVIGFSMQPTLNMTIDNENIDGDTVYINKYREYQSNDVVVARTSAENTRYVIKRVIGLQGDTIRIEQEADVYKLYVNEKVLYTKPVTENGLHGGDGSADYYKLYVNFISRHRGTDRIIINESGDECIAIGKNECFLMGDNWGESTDSISYGAINVSLIVGRVDFVIPYGESHFKGLMRGLWKILIKNDIM